MSTVPVDVPLSDVSDDDDIYEPFVPPGALGPLPGPDFQDIKNGLHSLARVFDAAIDKLPALLEKHAAQLQARMVATLACVPPEGAAALQHLCDLFEAVLKAGLSVRGAPYAATMHARSPVGYGLTLTIERTEGAAFFTALAAMEQWLKAQHYIPDTPIS